MYKILATEYKNQLSYLVKVVVNQQEYQEFKHRIETQVFKNLEVSGFRKGFVPEAIARKKVDPIKLKSTVYEESVHKFIPEINKEVEKLLKDDKRVIDKVSLAPESPIEETQEGLLLNLEYSLLSNVDLESVKNLEITKPQAKDLDGFIDLEQFRKKEIDKLIAVYNIYEEKLDAKTETDSQVILDITETEADKENPKSNQNLDIKFIIGTGQFPTEFETQILGLKAGQEKKFTLNLANNQKYNFEVKIKSVLIPTLTELKQIFDKNPEAVKNFKDISTFNELIEKTWHNQNQKLTDQALRQVIIHALVEKTPELIIDQNRLEQQTERIYSNLEKKAIAGKMSVLEAYNQSGLPVNPKLKEKEVKQEVKNYVSKELKLLAILEFIFFTQANRQKIPTLLEKIKKDIQANPVAFGLEVYEHKNEDGSKHLHPTNSEIETTAYDILVRQVSYTWLLSNIKSLQSPAK